MGQSFLALVTAMILVPTGVSAQRPPVSQGDGRVHGAPVLQVTEMDLKPGQVTTINLHPRFHTVLEFPAVVARVDGGDPDVFQVDLIGHKITLKALDVDIVETSMTVILGDARQTLIPFLVRADSTQPMAFVVRFTDGIARHLNEEEARIAARLNSNVDSRVTGLAEEHVRQRLLFKSGTINIGKHVDIGPRAERIRLIIEDAEQMPGPSGEPRLYLRYRILNGTRVPMADAHLVTRVETKKRRLLLFSRTEATDMGRVEDVRTDMVIPAGGAVRGMLILDGVHLRSNQAISIELVAFSGRRAGKVERVLVGTDR
jgi:hypothetical protein